jgi:hypothetical protein
MLLSRLDLKAPRSGGTLQGTYHASLSLINPSSTGRSRNLTRYSAVSASANSPVHPVHPDLGHRTCSPGQRGLGHTQKQLERER